MLTLRKSILFVCICFIVFGGLFYVITNTNLIKKDDIKVLTIWHPWNEKYEEKNDYLNNIIKKYEKEKNIKIKAKSFDSVNYRETIKLAYKSGEVPDIFIWWGANELKTLVESKKILKLDKYLPDSYKNSMGNNMISLDNVKKYIEFDEGLYGIPYCLYVATLFVNEDLFEKNGIDIPATFGELKNCCYYFREKDIEPIAVAGKESWPLQIWYNMLYLIRSDAKSYDETLENSFKSDNEAMILAAEDLLKLIEINGFQDDYINKNYNDSLESILKGKIPIILMGNWVIENLQNSDGENSSEVIDKMKPIILSKVDKDNNIIEKKEFLGGAIESIVVNSKTKYKNESTEIAFELAELISVSGYKKSNLVPVFNIKKEDKCNLDPIFRKTLDTIDNSKGNAIWWDVYFGDEINEYNKILEKLIKNEINSEEFVNRLKDKKSIESK